MGNRYVQPLRIAIQWLFLLFNIYLGVSLYRFVLHFRTGGTTAFVARPDGVEGFLPIAALLGVKDWLCQGRLNAIHPAAVVIFLTIIATALLLKRSFCSWLCPVGTISEACWKTGFTLFRRNLHPPRWLDRGVRGIKYLLLAFFVYFIWLGMSPQEIDAFIQSDYHRVADVRLLDFFLTLSGTALVVVLMLVALSVPLRNPFCRFLCPYGALLGLISVLSPVKVTRNTTHCVSCGVCTQVCPARIPVMSRKRVSSPECVGCWRCISHCRAPGALEMKLPGGRIALGGALFALLVIAIFWGGSLLGKATGHWHTGISRQEYERLLR